MAGAQGVGAEPRAASGGRAPPGRGAARSGARAPLPPSMRQSRCTNAYIQTSTGKRAAVGGAGARLGVAAPARRERALHGQVRAEAGPDGARDRAVSRQRDARRHARPAARGVQQRVLAHARRACARRGSGCEARAAGAGAPAARSPPRGGRPDALHRRGACMRGGPARRCSAGAAPANHACTPLVGQLAGSKPTFMLPAASFPAAGPCVQKRAPLATRHCDALHGGAGAAKHAQAGAHGRGAHRRRSARGCWSTCAAARPPAPPPRAARSSRPARPCRRRTSRPHPPRPPRQRRRSPRAAPPAAGAPGRPGPRVLCTAARRRAGGPCLSSPRPRAGAGVTHAGQRSGGRRADRGRRRGGPARRRRRARRPGRPRPPRRAPPPAARARPLPPGAARAPGAHRAPLRRLRRAQPRRPRRRRLRRPSRAPAAVRGRRRPRRARRPLRSRPRPAPHPSAARCRASRGLRRRHACRRRAGIAGSSTPAEPQALVFGAACAASYKPTPQGKDSPSVPLACSLRHSSAAGGVQGLACRALEIAVRIITRSRQICEHMQTQHCLNVPVFENKVYCHKARRPKCTHTAQIVPPACMLMARVCTANSAEVAAVEAHSPSQRRKADRRKLSTHPPSDSAHSCRTSTADCNTLLSVGWLAPSQPHRPSGVLTDSPCRCQP